jgi:hypothetical protein
VTYNNSDDGSYDGFSSWDDFFSEWQEGDPDFWKTTDFEQSYSNFPVIRDFYNVPDEEHRGPNRDKNRLNFFYGSIFMGPQPNNFEALPKMSIDFSYLESALDLAEQIVAQRPQIADSLLRNGEGILRSMLESNPYQLAIDRNDVESRLESIYGRFNDVAKLVVLYEHNV